MLFFWQLGMLAHSQSLKKPTRFITGRDGLPQSFITGLAQDKAGFIWVGTSDGLARYDGRQFKVFYHRNDDTTSLSSNFIVGLHTGANNQLWVSSPESVDILDPTTEKITHLPLPRKNKEVFLNRGRLLIPNRQHLWLIQENQGLLRFSRATKRMESLTRQSHGLLSDTVRAMMMDKRQTLWFFTQRGFSKFDEATQKFEPAPCPYPIAPSDNFIDRIVASLCRKNGELMVATYASCLFFNPLSRSYRSVPWPNNTHAIVHFFQESPTGEVLVEINGTIYRYTDRDGFVALWDGPANGLDKGIQSMLLDRSGMLWLGTNTGGLCVIDLDALPFYSTRYSLGFQADVFRGAMGVALPTSFVQSTKKAPMNAYAVRYAYFQERYWMIYQQQAAYFDAKHHVFGRLPSSSTLYSDKHFTGISIAPNGRLWCLLNQGTTAYFDPVHNRWVDSLKYTMPSAEIEVNDLLADDGFLWITTSDGLNCLDLSTRKRMVYNQRTHPDVFLTHRYLDLERDPFQSHILWISSYDGLVRFDTKTKKGRVFTSKDGFPNNTIYSIVPDDRGYLWLTTNRGICRFDPQTFKIQQFKSYQGLQGEEFNRFHHFKLPDGRIAVGGTEGWTIFDPQQLKDDKYEPSVMLTGLKINNVSSEYGEPGSFLKAPLNHLTEIELPSDKNSLSFEFASTQYNQPDKRLFRYQLEGVDAHWVLASTFPVATYTQLKPGRYVLKVNAANASGVWSRDVKALSLYIHPPIWATGWAYFLYFLVGTGLVFFYYRLQNERRQEQLKALQKQSEAQQLRAVNEIKTRFFSNITHEFRTPLTLILAPIDQLLRDKALASSTQATLEVIKRNAHQLLRLINQLLDLAKLEESSLPISLSRGNPVAFIQERVEAFRPLAVSNGLYLYFERTEVQSEWLVDTDKLEKIVYNLLSNAVKFTPKGGSIWCRTALSVADKEALLKIEVEDKGVGIAEADIGRIFDRFFQIGQTEPVSQRNGGDTKTGTGIGLALTKELVELLGGTISVKSKIGTGTIFKVVLPVKEPNGEEKKIEGEEPLKSDEVAAQTEEKQAVIANAPLILVVDDNADLRQFISQALSAQNYQVITASDGEEAWRLTCQEMPDLVISDVMMPNLDGYGLCQRIKQTSVTSHIAVVLLTAKTADASKIEGLAVGANDYLTKPFDLNELLLRVQNWVNYQLQLRDFLQKRLVEKGKPVVQQTLGDAFLQRLYDVLDAELANPDFTVEKLARELAVSTRTLHRKLSSLVNLSPIEVVRTHRFRKAAAFLQEGYSVSETAMKVGIENLPYFSQSFRDFFDVTPSEYAQRHRH